MLAEDMKEFPHCYDNRRLAKVITGQGRFNCKQIRILKYFWREVYFNWTVKGLVEVSLLKVFIKFDEDFECCFWFWWQFWKMVRENPPLSPPLLYAFEHLGKGSRKSGFCCRWSQLLLLVIILILTIKKWFMLSFPHFCWGPIYFSVFLRKSSTKVFLIAGFLLSS